MNGTTRTRPAFTRGYLLSQLATKSYVQVAGEPLFGKPVTPRLAATAALEAPPSEAPDGYAQRRWNETWRVIIKLAEDKVLGAMLLLAIGPLMGVIALLIKLDSRGPVFFVQRRFGYKNSVINVLKFRTMYVDRGDPSGAQRTVPNDPRVTRLGRLLRLFSLDELPQLINVVRGDMSLKGPQPHAIAMKVGDRPYGEVEHYDLRHNVKPGMTGLAQVNGCRGEV